MDVLQGLRVAKGHEPPPPVVIYSSDDGVRVEALRLGAAAFVSKREGADVLLSIVKQQLERLGAGAW